MASYIFLSSDKTEQECLERLLLGTSSEESYLKYFSGINVGDTLFLYNYDRQTIRGPFRAISNCRKDIEHNAWVNANGKGYHFQVRIDNSHVFREVLSGRDLRNLMPFYGKFPSAKISEQVQEKLIGKLSQISNVTNLEGYYIKNISSYYIFKCDAITGGKLFDDNVLGAPSELYQSIVGRIQAGDILFVWLINERKLYGLWQANSRGQYNPKEFTNFPAVVYCSRKTNYENGITERELRNIISFNSPHPPYIISYDQGQRIIQELGRVNNSHQEKMQPPLSAGQYTSEDGHIVKSQGELIIDNWLFHNNLIHSYEHRIQRNDDYLMTDFYMPNHNIYIEYWGLIYDSNYKIRKQEKIKFYREHNLKLLELFPRDLSMLSEILKVKLSALGVNLP